MQILTSSQIKQKTKRLAIEILENNYKEKEIILAGINNNGLGFAKLIQKELKSLTEIDIRLTQLKVNPANPVNGDITIGLPVEDLKNKVIIVVDDVANTGRTMFYAFEPILKIIPRKVEVAVLVDRQHKSFPIHPDYVGISLATTLKENIDVQILDKKNWSVHLN